jgi:hypothetical protein
VINPSVRLKGDVKTAAKAIGTAKKLARQSFAGGLVSKFLDVGNATIQVENLLKAGVSRATITASRGEQTVFAEFESAIIRYTWTASSGRDLDTVTYISSPNFAAQSVGWVVGRSYTPTSVTDINLCYLYWNGDNTTAVGSEAILINFKRLIDDYPALNEFILLMHGTWYGYKLSGEITLDFETYNGGTFDISSEQYNITNVGGELVQQISRSVVVDLAQPSANPGQLIGTLTYRRDNNTFILTT